MVVLILRLWNFNLTSLLINSNLHNYFRKSITITWLRFHKKVHVRNRRIITIMVAASGIVSGIWVLSHGWIADQVLEAVAMVKRRSLARVWSGRQAPKRTARVCTWPRSSRRYAPARRQSCRYLPHGRGNLSPSPFGLMAGEARG